MIITARTIPQLLARGEDDAVAISSLGAPPLSYRALRALAAETDASLRAAGAHRNSRFALVLPTPPVLATALVAIASGSIVVPLNPAFREAEFADHLTTTGIDALVTLRGWDTPARSAAAACGTPLIELVPSDAAAGDFRLDIMDVRLCDSGEVRPSAPDDVALILHTSGTTAKPRRVPLRHRNITASAGNIAACLALTPADLCMNIMPLFHIHGIIGAVFSSLAVGAGVAITPGFEPFRAFDWIAEFRPTWLTAVPTMYQALVSAAKSHPANLAGARLRFVRSSSAPLLPRVFDEIEQLFRVPVIESYGMTEATHQMASNRLPPHPRYAGSVGPAAGPDIAIMDDDGTLLEAGELGEVVVRGANVTDGYEGDPIANARAFTDGWFRTGDQGYLDDDGHLWLTGRLKEIINRGGEKIAPAEVDAVLIEHPAVRQVVTFALPDELLGEVVGAAIVMEDGAVEDEVAVRDFAAARLAPYKVPDRILFVRAIPTAASGKLIRIGLAKKLGLI